MLEWRRIPSPLKGMNTTLRIFFETAGLKLEEQIGPLEFPPSSRSFSNSEILLELYDSWVLEETTILRGGI